MKTNEDVIKEVSLMLSGLGLLSTFLFVLNIISLNKLHFEMYNIKKKMVPQEKPEPQPTMAEPNWEPVPQKQDNSEAYLI